MNQGPDDCDTAVAAGADAECDGWATPDFVVRSASVRGGVGDRRDCAVTAVQEASGAVLFVVAAGTGHHAAQACQGALEQLLFLLSGNGGLMDFDRVAHHTAVDGYVTTLVAGVVQPEPGGPRLQACRIGGSGAWLLDRATGSHHALFGAEQGSDTDLVEQAVEHLTGSEVLLVGTDGFGELFGDGGAEVSEVGKVGEVDKVGEVATLLARHLAVPPTPPRFAQVLGSARPPFDSDRTLVAVWPAADR